MLWGGVDFVRLVPGTVVSDVYNSTSRAAVIAYGSQNFTVSYNFDGNGVSNVSHCGGLKAWLAVA